MNFCSTLLNLSLKFASAWFYCLSKYTEKREQKLNGKNLNVNIQFFKDVIHNFDVAPFNLIAGDGGNTNS